MHSSRAMHEYYACTVHVGVFKGAQSVISYSGVDIERFTADSDYRKETILGLAM